MKLRIDVIVDVQITDPNYTRSESEITKAVIPKESKSMFWNIKWYEPLVTVEEDE